ncbi:MAG: 4Fe-4S binding protein [Candidatus Omnitrophota bacterium]
MKKLVALRRASQILFLLLFVGILWSTTYPMSGAIPPEIIFKLDPLVMVFLSLCGRVVLPGAVLSLIMIAATLVFGRFFCGWVCPLGTFNDGLSSLRRSKRVPADASNRKIRSVKYGLLAGIAACAIAGFQAAWFFDPLVIFARFVSLNLIPTVTMGLDRLFVTAIQKFELYGGLYDFYRLLKGSILGIRADYFSNAWTILIFFLSVCLPVLLVSRIWCRMLCPLGALYAWASKKSWLERKTGECTGCGACRAECRMGAIRDDGKTVPGECILCMDCVYSCPASITTFGWKKPARVPRPGAAGNQRGMTRSDFLLLLAASASFLGFRSRLGLAQTPPAKAGGTAAVVRPPGALPEKDFLDRCIRCGNCMKVCVTNGLQPVFMESGWEGIWTPQLVPEIGYCEYQCTLCGGVCPTGAIPKLSRAVKQKQVLGIAVIARNLCLPWAEGKSCIVCEEHCPTPDKAIKNEKILLGTSLGRKQYLLRPVVVKELCIGCGICQKVCPLRPSRAIRVDPAGKLQPQ